MGPPDYVGNMFPVEIRGLEPTVQDWNTHETTLPENRVNFPQRGIPFPDPAALGSNTHMDAFSYMYRSELYANFDPARHVIMIEGRPVCCLIVSHNRPPPFECDPYMLTALRPLRPLILFGVTAGSHMAPKMKAKFSVTEWWKVTFFFRVGEPVAPTS